MITPTSLANLSAPEKAQIIYEQVRSDMAGRLWRAALGIEEAAAISALSKKEGPKSLNLLLALLDERSASLSAAASAAASPTIKANLAPAPNFEGGVAAIDPDAARRHQPQQRENGSDEQGDSAAASAMGGVPSVAARRGYGPNAVYAGILEAAGRRTGLPAAALATIVHAEAAKDREGRWMPYSRNPRSSAAGLGQFLNSTWLGEAARKGSWLNHMAQQQGWIGQNGEVKKAHRSALLSLRYNPEAAIQATADYASANLAALCKAGVAMEGGAQGIAKAAYLGHHLGIGDAIRFLKGGLNPERARTLLNAQVGTAAAARHIAAVGNAASAHKTWLTDYISKNIQVNRFSA